MKTLVKQIREVVDRKDLLFYLVKSDLSVLYKNKVMGYLWAVLDPLLLMVVYITLMKILGRGGPQFPVLLFAALLPWRWFQLSVNNAVGVIRKNGKLIQTVKFPHQILPLHHVTIGSINYLLGLIILIPMLFVFDANVNANIFWFVPVFMIQLVFTIGWSLIMSYVGVFLPDMQNVLTFGMRIGFYLSPALYPIEFIPERFRDIYVWLNPFAGFFESYKAAFVYGVSPAEYLPMMSVHMVLAVILGSWLYGKKNSNFAKDV